MRSFYLIALIGMLLSCNIFDKEEDIPGFIYIDYAHISTHSFQGANSSNIVDVAAFANNRYLGTFELPATIPTLETGEVNFFFEAGIRNNGMIGDRRIYPFYTGQNKEITIIPDAVVPVTLDSSLQFQYYEQGLKYYIEDFESTGYELVEGMENTAQISQISSPPEDIKDGYTLKVSLNSEHDTFEAHTDWGLTQLPKGNPMYLEIDFKGNAPLHIGLMVVAPEAKEKFVLGLVPQEKFTKVYINLTDKIAREIAAQKFEISFNSTLPKGETEAELFIDNIKFIYPQ